MRPCEHNGPKWQEHVWFSIFQPRLQHWAKRDRSPEDCLKSLATFLFGLECCDFSYVPNSLVHTAQGLTPTTSKMEMRTRYGDADEMRIAMRTRFGGQKSFVFQFWRFDADEMRNVRISQ